MDDLIVSFVLVTTGMLVIVLGYIASSIKQSTEHLWSIRKHVRILVAAAAADRKRTKSERESKTAQVIELDLMDDFGDDLLGTLLEDVSNV
jgi:hypothetical protein